MPNFTYVVLRDKGTEGLSAPLTAFANPAEANAFVKLMLTSVDNLAVYEVQLWPDSGSRKLSIDSVR